MNKRFLTLLLAISTSLQALVLPKKPWTFFTYIAGKNDLAPFVKPDINEMQKGANSNVNVLVYANVIENRHSLSKKMVITKKEITEIDVEENLDSGDISTLMNALKWGISTSPSDYIAIGLWNHGSAMTNPPKTRAICFDDYTSHYLDDRDVQTALEFVVKKRGNKKIDILFLDACLMANLECIATWSNYANFIVASEQTIPNEGYNYEYVLSYLNNVIEPQAFASKIVDSYKENYEDLENNYTLSAISTEKIDKLARNVDKIASTLLELIHLDNTTKKIIRESRNNTISFRDPSCIDLGHFYANLLANMGKLRITKKDNKIINELRYLLVKGITLVLRCVINNVTGPYYASATGISIYFPTEEIDPSYQELYWTESYPNWHKLLKRILI